MKRKLRRATVLLFECATVCKHDDELMLLLTKAKDAANAAYNHTRKDEGR